MVSEAEWEEQMLDELSFHGWIPRPARTSRPAPRAAASRGTTSSCRAGR